MSLQLKGWKQWWWGVGGGCTAGSAKPCLSPLCQLSTFGHTVYLLCRAAGPVTCRSFPTGARSAKASHFLHQPLDFFHSRLILHTQNLPSETGCVLDEVWHHLNPQQKQSNSEKQFNQTFPKVTHNLFFWPQSIRCRSNIVPIFTLAMRWRRRSKRCTLAPHIHWVNSQKHLDTALDRHRPAECFPAGGLHLCFTVLSRCLHEPPRLRAWIIYFTTGR